MANSSPAPVKKIDGDYDRDFTPVMNALETRLAGTNIKHAAVADFRISWSLYIWKIVKLP